MAEEIADAEEGAEGHGATLDVGALKEGEKRLPQRRQKIAESAEGRGDAIGEGLLAARRARDCASRFGMTK